MIYLYLYLVGFVVSLVVVSVHFERLHSGRTVGYGANGIFAICFAIVWPLFGPVCLLSWATGRLGAWLNDNFGWFP